MGAGTVGVTTHSAGRVSLTCPAEHSWPRLRLGGGWHLSWMCGHAGPLLCSAHAHAGLLLLDWRDALLLWMESGLLAWLQHTARLLLGMKRLSL